MPSRSMIQVTAGSGTKMATSQYTDGTDVKHDEVIVHGEQHLATYRIPVSQTSVATANSHLLQLMAGSSLHLYVRSIRIYQAAVATTAAINSLALVRLTTAGTGGTGMPITALDTADSAAGAAAMTLPAAKGTEAANALDYATIYWLQTIPTAVDFQPLRAVWSFDGPRSKGLRIPSGTANGVAIKNLTAVAGATVVISVEFSEAPY